MHVGGVSTKNVLIFKGSVLFSCFFSFWVFSQSHTNTFEALSLVVSLYHSPPSLSSFSIHTQAALFSISVAFFFFFFCYSCSLPHNTIWTNPFLEVLCYYILVSCTSLFHIAPLHSTTSPLGSLYLSHLRAQLSFIKFF